MPVYLLGDFLKLNHALFPLANSYFSFTGLRIHLFPAGRCFSGFSHPFEGCSTILGIWSVLLP